MALLSPSLSPAITIKEIDLSGVAPNVSTSVGAFVGNFRWGPVNSQTLVADEAGLVRAFAAPNEDNAVDFHSASYFLKYTNSLYIVRGNNEGTNAHSAATKLPDSGDSAAVVESLEDWETNVSSSVKAGTLKTGSFIAKYPGSLGNALTVAFCPASDSDAADFFSAWSYKGSFDREPTTSAYATENGASKDEVHVAIIDRTGSFTGTPGSVLETFPHLSVAKGAVTPDGSPNYISDVINTQSGYVWNGIFADDSAFGTSHLSMGQMWGRTPSVDSAIDYSTGSSAWSDSASKIKLGGGRNSEDLGSTEITTGFDLFDDAEALQVDFLIPPQSSGDSAAVTIANYLNAIAKDRKDCVVPVSPNRDGIIGVTTSTANTNAISFANSLSNSSYLIVDNNYLKVFDKYNDQYIYIPANSSTAGIMAATDFVAAPWFSPAGQRRGNYLAVTDIAHSPNKAQRDALYKANVNPVANIPGVGIVLYGDKTHELRPSAFDRINVRRLFIGVEKSIAQAAKNILFEFNDEFTRAEFVNVVEPLLREIKGRRGITDFKVVCDETNNTPAVIDRNEFVASIFIKPARSINFVTLNFVAVRSGVDFEEVVGTV
tara:strand:- start:4915 stop:6717 length:1803 start_codon:yes stop_codon:yes gene_type:complete